MRLYMHANMHIHAYISFTCIYIEYRCLHAYIYIVTCIYIGYMHIYRTYMFTSIDIVTGMFGHIQIICRKERTCAPLRSI